jgi:DNA-binding MarR family transcriptional regulator
MPTLRLTRIEHRVLRAIREQPAISLDLLAALVEADRSSIRVAIRSLQLKGLISYQRGRGPQPNRYAFIGKELSHGMVESAV